MELLCTNFVRQHIPWVIGIALVIMGAINTLPYFKENVILLIPACSNVLIANNQFQCTIQSTIFYLLIPFVVAFLGIFIIALSIDGICALYNKVTHLLTKKIFYRPLEFKLKLREEIINEDVTHIYAIVKNPELLIDTQNIEIYYIDLASSIEFTYIMGWEISSGETKDKVNIKRRKKAKLYIGDLANRACRIRTIGYDFDWLSFQSSNKAQFRITGMVNRSKNTEIKQEFTLHIVNENNQLKLDLSYEKGGKPYHDFIPI